MTLPSPVLVTGAQGFLGRALVRSLQARGAEVRGIDDLSAPGARDAPPFPSLTVGNVEEVGTLQGLTPGVQAVVHLAARDVSPEAPVEGYRSNVLGTLSVLRAATAAGVPRIVLASDASVYGNAGAPPFSEQRALGPVGLRGAAYAARELLGRTYAERGPSQVVALRLFHVYGRGRRGSHHPGILTRFGEEIAAGRPPQVPGTGELARDFLHLDDAVDAFEHALERRVGRWTVVNVGTGVPVTIRDAAELACEALGRPDLEPVSVEPSRDPAVSSFADMRSARTVLGLEPKVSLAEGLARRDWFLP
jgi:UDP-glucose 4-epimerase